MQSVPFAKGEVTHEGEGEGESKECRKKYILHV
jgi:hypothetical protein